MKKDQLYLVHIIECIERIEQYKPPSLNNFLSDIKTQDAIIRNLQILAESSQRISQETKISFPDISWRGIAGFRNLLVHDYLSINIERVWLIIDNDLPGLKTGIQNILSSYEK
ncbi:MAG TPA: DUF86 domain-containing protein [Bacteroidetes bacterium]|nr:DUF86 domain-containing protein [Bacteroidota bacterium]